MSELKEEERFLASLEMTDNCMALWWSECGVLASKTYVLRGKAGRWRRQ
jgi:hypothetical protein